MFKKKTESEKLDSKAKKLSHKEKKEAVKIEALASKQEVKKVKRKEQKSLKKAKKKEKKHAKYLKENPILIEPKTIENISLDSFESQYFASINKKFKSQTTSYHLIRELEGNEVCLAYLVEDDANNKYLLKLFDQVEETAFASYLELAKGNSSNNILPYIDSGIFDNKTFLIYDLKVTTSLASINQELQFEDLFNYIIPGLINALEAYHRKDLSNIGLDLARIYVDKDKKTIYLDDPFTAGFTLGKQFAVHEGYNSYLHLKDSKKSDFYNLGILLLEYVLKKNPFKGYTQKGIFTAIYTKEIFAQISDTNMANLIRGLLLVNEKGRFGTNELRMYLEGTTFNDMVHFEDRLINDFQELRNIAGFEVYNRRDLGVKLTKNWSTSIYWIEDGSMRDIIKAIDEPFIVKYDEVVKSASNSEEIMSVLINYFDIGPAMVYQGKAMDSLESLGNFLTEQLPQIDENLLNLISSRSCLSHLEILYLKTKNKRLLDYIYLFKLYEDDNDLLYYYVGYAFASNPYLVLYEGKAYNELSRLIPHLLTERFQFCDVLFSNKNLYAYLLYMLDQNLIVSAYNSSNPKRFYYLLAALKEDKIDVSKIVERLYSSYLIKNIKLYKFKSKEAKSLLKAFKKENLNEPITYEILARRDELVSKFLNMFQNNVFFDFKKEDITTKQFENYPVVPFHNEKVSVAYLKKYYPKRDVNYPNLFFNSTIDETINKIDMAKDDVNTAYSLYYYDFKGVDEKLRLVLLKKLKKTYFVSVSFFFILLMLYIGGYFLAKAYIVVEKYIGFMYSYYIPTLVCLGLVPILYIFLLIPFKLRLRRLRKYEKALANLIQSQTFIKEMHNFVIVDEKKTKKKYKKSELSAYRINYDEVIIGNNVKIKDCAKYRFKGNLRMYLVKWSERLFTMAHAALFTIGFNLVFLEKILLMLNKNNFNFKMVLLIPLGLSFVILFLSFFTKKKANLGRIYYWLSFILVFALNLTYFVLI